MADENADLAHGLAKTNFIITMASVGLFTAAVLLFVL